MIVSPLTKSKPITLQWTVDCEHTFNQLKHHLCNSPVLMLPDFSRDFLLQSNRGVGADLSQIDKEGVEHSVAHYSCEFLPKEEKYSTVERNVWP